MKRKEKIKDFKRMNPKELARVSQEKREKLRQFRFDLDSGKIKNIREIRETRRDIARIMTLMKRKVQSEKRKTTAQNLKQ